MCHLDSTWQRSAPHATGCVSTPMQTARTGRAVAAPVRGFELAVLHRAGAVEGVEADGEGGEQHTAMVSAQMRATQDAAGAGHSLELAAGSKVTRPHPLT